ncbi:MAG: serine hydrolase domain-containing protein [Bacteroidota bacterium]
MNILKKVWRFLVICCLCCFSTFAQIATPLSPNDKALDSIGARILNEDTILGFSVTIASGNRIVYNKGFGYIDVDKTKPITNKTRFDIASISKLIGVNIIMKLVEQNKLNLDSTLDMLMPEFPEKELARKIQLRHLLSHTSGLYDYALEIDNVFKATGVLPKKEDFLAFFKGKQLLFTPGDNYQYCDSGFMLMAYIAENATGKDWQQLIDTYINKPDQQNFQLIEFAAEWPETSPINDFVMDGFKTVPTWTYVIGDGGLTATSAMLALFPSFWTKGKIITPSSYDEMIVPKQLNDGTTIGYGLGVRNGEFLGERIIGHTGGWKNTFAIMAHFPEREITFVGLMNTDDSPTSVNTIFSKYMAEVLKKSRPDYTTNAIIISNGHEYSGTYHGWDVQYNNEGTKITIQQKEEGQLFYCLKGSCEKLFPMGDNRFWLKNYPYDFIEFQMNDQGQALAIREYYYGFFQVLRKKVP